jgi:hypothetical protein
MNLRPKIGSPATPAAFIGLQFRAYRLGLRFPAAWRSTARRRRFLFLGLCAPGFIAFTATPLHQNVWVLLLGLAEMGLAYVFRRLSEPLFVALGVRDARIKVWEA